MSLARYVCGADIAFKGDQKFACSPMAICDTALEAAKANEDLHSSFGYAIYKVDVDAQREVTLCFGFRAGRKTTGLQVLEYVGQAYAILKANDQSA